MSKTVKLSKGLDIKLVGEAEKIAAEFSLPNSISVRPSDFHGLTPKMVVKAGDKINAGDVLFYNKYQESVKCVSPVSGTVRDIVRGEKRRILEVIVDADGQQNYSTFAPIDPNAATREEIKEQMLQSGLWMFIKQRPIDVVANPEITPKAIFISAFDSAPLAADNDFMLHGEGASFQAGIDALAKLTDGKVHLTLNGKGAPDAVFSEAKNVQINKIVGKHPAGNVGTQIHHLDPINKGEFVWTVNAQDVAIIGRSLLAGKYDASKMIALTGSEVKNRKYFKTVACANVSEFLKNNIEGDNVRVVSGNPLTGDRISEEGYLGFYANQITVLPEGNQYKFFLTKGWLGLGFDKYSNSRLFPTFLMPNKRQRLDTNTNGEERGFVVTGELEKVFPFDIYPMQLVKAAITDDIDGMENLGIYEVIPEDFALCEYVCTSKINIQDKIRTALDLIQDECM